MAKQVIIAAMEEVFGEYILNMSKENLKIAALRGKIMLENVQLDGDLIGSHVLGAVGLTGFGVLSCSAKSIRISVPWKNLEKEPTRLDMEGVHLVCVPLTPFTANKMYGASTPEDPRCSLRTRAKRLVLARLERNYWNGQIPDEGPPMKRIQRAVREVERDLRKKGSQKAHKLVEDSEIDETIDTILNDLNQSIRSQESETKSSNDASFSADSLPELPRDWKVRLREKVLRNMEATLKDVHIRCEVCQGGLDTANSSFALGFTLESFIVRTANENWEVGKHDKKNPVDGTAMSSAKGHLGPNEYVVKNNKIGFYKHLSWYWDDEPPVLLAETDTLQGNYKKLSTEKLHSRVAEAMSVMFHNQEPGDSVRKAFSLSESDPDRLVVPHQFVCENLCAEVRVRASDRTEPGPISCSADVMPFEFSFNIRPHQYVQYQLLQSSIKAQQRFDTMLRQRPDLSPKEDPLAWWKYAVACVTLRPNSRPWHDIMRITRCRKRYVDLVIKKNERGTRDGGFHSGLSNTESAELLVLEDILPIEALLAFHLLALRAVYVRRYAPEKYRDPSRVSPARGLGKTSNIFRLSRKKSRYSQLGPESDGLLPLDDDSFATTNSFTSKADDSGPIGSGDVSGAKTLSLLQVMTLRLGKKVWYIDWRLHDATIKVAFFLPRQDAPFARLTFQAKGRVRSFGKGKRDFLFDIVRCDIDRYFERILFMDIKYTHGTRDDVFGHSFEVKCTDLRKEGPDAAYASSFLDFPPSDIVCRIVAAKDHGLFNFSLALNPTSIVWTSSLLRDMVDFAFSHAGNRQIDLAQLLHNAATPLARRAQLALLSPSSKTLHLNVASPKIWVPIGPDSPDGALMLDVGTLTLTSKKYEGELSTNWKIKAADIQVSFLRGVEFKKLTETHSIPSVLPYDVSPKGRSSVVRPFNISASISSRSAPVETKDLKARSGPSQPGNVRATEILVSPVCLDLVDAEALARVFGKWYASGLRRVHRKDNRYGLRRSAGEILYAWKEKSRNEEDVPSGNSYLLHQLSLCIEKVEVALEGHSKRSQSLLDERSFASQDDSIKDFAPPIRTYIVELFLIELHRSVQNQVSRTTISLEDVSIVRLRDASIYSPFRVKKEILDTEYCILVRPGSQRVEEPEVQNDDSRGRCGSVLQASHLHDGTTHLDEVELDVEGVVLRITPTTLKDCSKAFRRIVELAQVITKEMERKVHEEGRRARRRDDRAIKGDLNFDTQSAFSDRALSPTFSDVVTEFSAIEKKENVPSDSSILFKVTMKDTTILAGRPTVAQEAPPHGNASFAVIQVLSNALIMFQSIENPDASGTKTLHISIENASSLVNTEFERLSPEVAPPMIGPTGAEFRVVYATENQGCVVSQDISFDCELIKSCLTPNDLSVYINVSRKLFERMRAFGQNSNVDSRAFGKQSSQNPISTLIRYQKKGTGIATTIKAEIQSFSFVLLRAYKSQFGAPEFLDFKVEHVKGRFGGCLSALSGDCSGEISVNTFNSEVDDWEYAIEPFPVKVSIEQMPNDVVLEILPRDKVQINLTGILLRDLSEMKFDILRERKKADFDRDGGVLSPSALSTLGLRRATIARHISIENLTGLDIHVVPDFTAFSPESGLVRDGCITCLEMPQGNGRGEDVTLSLRLALSSINLVGAREPVYDLPSNPTSQSDIRIYLLRPITSWQRSGDDASQQYGGRWSPETVGTEGSLIDYAYYHAEPVVEWCMQNQRLRGSVPDVYSLPKGQDLLSNSVWSPDDCTISSRSPATDVETSPPPSTNGHWAKPSLKNDLPEWTDMTCTLHMARERVMLPDNFWMWVNDWTIDLSGSLGHDTDADGWEYQDEFESFTRNRRFYQRGDTCRRRHWTRTRMVRPPTLNDPHRRLSFVWESSKDANGNPTVKVRSYLRVLNKTMTTLSFFVFDSSWDGDELVGISEPGNVCHVPVRFATAAYMRLAKKQANAETNDIDNFDVSERFVIVPIGYNSTSLTRVSLPLDDVTNTTLHFIIEIKSQRGAIDVIVEPVFRVVNLLPCQVDCRVKESLRDADFRVYQGGFRRVGKPSGVVQTETFDIHSGKEGVCTAVSPWRKPAISLRVPGYDWSPFQRIVNRKANCPTWRPQDSEEDHHFNSKGDADFADEFKTIAKLKRQGSGGDHLILILSVECGHCPVLRVYAQYWIVDKTGFGCRFTEGFADILGNVPEEETSRRSHLTAEDSKNHAIRNDMSLPGHEWSIGMNGMTLYFSRREKLALAIECGAGSGRKGRKSQAIRSRWTSPLDISNVMPKTVFSVDELNGPRRFELAVCVTVCPGVFARTKLITLLPRYQIVNLLHRELFVAQDGYLDSETRIPSQSAVPFHWEKANLAPKVRLGTQPFERTNREQVDNSWTNGKFRIDRVGITSLRLPTQNVLGMIPMVIQAEVRLATKDQSCAVVIMIWSSNEKSNPLYKIRNNTQYTILCRQPLQDDTTGYDERREAVNSVIDGCSGRERGVMESCSGKEKSALERCSGTKKGRAFECGAEFGPIILSFLGLDRIEEFVWILKRKDVLCFGFDDPEMPHILEWTFVSNQQQSFDEKCDKAFLEVDAMGSTSVLRLPAGRLIKCQIVAEHSTKVIEFSEDDALGRYDSAVSQVTRSSVLKYEISQSVGPFSNTADQDEEEDIVFSLRVDIPSVSLSFVDNAVAGIHGREILFAKFENIAARFSQTREGYHEIEFQIKSFQVDNHVHKSIHPVLLFCPNGDENEPLFHLSAVRRLQLHSNTYVFRYAAVRLLEIEVFIDRRTAEIIARFIEPVTAQKFDEEDERPDWVTDLTKHMSKNFAKPDRRAPRDLEKTAQNANSGRIYFEQLHLHPVRLSLTFTQEWIDWNSGADTMMIFQFIRGMASIANAPLVFTSFVVAHVFEAPQALIRVIATHYSSQLTKQIFAILGSLAIFGAPADFITNVGTGVRDFFYEPIQGAVHGPRQFIEGLEAGTQSLARGVFVGVFRGAAGVTEVVNSNLAGLTADDDFIDERKAHQRMLTDAMSRGVSNRTFADALSLAGASLVRGIKSGALGIVEQPAMYASRHGPVGFLKGVGKAVVGAVVKPIVGLGDGAVLVMNHMSDATSKKQIVPKIPKRLRRALPSLSPDKLHCVKLTPFDERAAKAQKIVTGGESLEDVYLGHIDIPSHLIIASEQCLWAIDKRSREPWCVSWQEVSHFSVADGGVRIVVFSQNGLRTFVFATEKKVESSELQNLLSMQTRKMGNSSELNSLLLSAEPESMSRHQLPGVKSRQVNHVFGSCNHTRPNHSMDVKDEIDVVEQCFSRVRALGSDSPSFFKTIDEEAWDLISNLGQVFSGLSSRRCLVAGVINGTGCPIQIKSSKFMEGGSPCYSIPTKEFDSEQGILRAGGVIMFFGWGVVPNLNQSGSLFLTIETNCFVSDLCDQKSNDTFAQAMPGYQVGFLEKSYDDSGWWAKFWLLVRAM